MNSDPMPRMPWWYNYLIVPALILVALYYAPYVMPWIFMVKP